MRSSLLIVSLFLYAHSSFSYFSLMDTGEVKKEGSHRVLGEAQVLFDEPKGLNINGRFATGIREDAEIQFEAGVGSVDYYLGAFYKWVPFPDTDEQPAIGVRGGLTFAEVANYSTYGFNVTPLVSKAIGSGVGNFTPYTGLQMGLQKNTYETFFSMQLAVGVEWSPSDWDFQSISNFNFLLEFGFAVDDSFDYMSLGTSYDF